jgi:hypothetical protein
MDYPQYGKLLGKQLLQISRIVPFSNCQNSESMRKKGIPLPLGHACVYRSTFAMDKKNRPV